MIKYILGAIVCCASALSNATVINYSDVGGFTTFQDTNTGRVWLDMDNFFDDAANNGTSGYNMILAAQNAGFTFATLADVQGLLNSLPLTSGEWATYAPIMGYGIPRQLIWGMYDDANGNPFGWAWSFSPNLTWSYANDIADANLIQNSGIEGAVDLGIWAYRSGNIQVSEPFSMSIFALGLFGLALSRRKMKR